MGSIISGCVAQLAKPIPQAIRPADVSDAARVVGRQGGRPKGSVAPHAEWLRSEMAAAKGSGYSCRELFEILAESEIRDGMDAFFVSRDTADRLGIPEKRVAWDAFKKLWARQGHLAVFVPRTRHKLFLARTDQEFGVGRLLSRVKQIEAQMPGEIHAALLLREPGAQAGGDEVAEFQAKVFEARQAGRVVVIHSSGADHIKPLPCVVIVETAFDAFLAQAANSPAQSGPGDRLSEIIRKAQGTSLPVIPKEMQQ